MTLPVVILTNERDFGADVIIRNLTDSERQVIRLNFERATRSDLPQWYQSDPNGATLTPHVVWKRQFEAYDGPPANLREAEDRLISRAQWRAWLSMLDHSESVWINDLWSARRAENKIIQLRTAKRCGFDVPATRVVNSRQAARQFANEHDGRVVIKSLTTAYYEFTEESFVFTQRWNSGSVSSEDEASWHAQPVVVQQEVFPGDYDARVVAFGDAVVGAVSERRPGGPVDWRAQPQNQWTEWPVPDVLRSQCLDYLRSLDLRYCAFDFVIGPRVWFLEANQAGEWHFLDRQAHLNIGAGLTNYLLELSEV
jgi:glutathione synthase/RimK-type ligase-like ATP-grasp enzyme